MSNNLLVLMVLLAVMVSLIGFLDLMRMEDITITGAASSGAGLTNLSITESFSIKMVKNISDFGASTLPSSVKTWISTKQNNTNATQQTLFSNGSEGNGTNYGTGAFVYPFVVENDGNDNTTCVKVNSGTATATFIGGTSQGGPVFNTMATENETVACSGGTTQSTWTQMNTSSGTGAALVCSTLHSDAAIDEVRIHWQLGIPDDAISGGKTNTITVTAYNTCP